VSQQQKIHNLHRLIWTSLYRSYLDYPLQCNSSVYQILRVNSCLSVLILRPNNQCNPSLFPMWRDLSCSTSLCSKSWSYIQPHLTHVHTVPSLTIRNQAIFITRVGPVQKVMGQTLFFRQQNMGPWLFLCDYIDGTSTFFYIQKWRKKKLNVY
jgi:hypothetical protein